MALASHPLDNYAEGARLLDASHIVIQNPIDLLTIPSSLSVSLGHACSQPIRDTPFFFGFLASRSLMKY